MSFALTTAQVRARTKTVTRRLGWEFLEPGDRVMAVEKAQGIKKGELVRLGLIEVVSKRREPLHAITQEDVVKEGFPHMTTEEFIRHFCESMGVRYAQICVTRIEFKYVDEGAKGGEGG